MWLNRTILAILLLLTVCCAPVELLSEVVDIDPVGWSDAAKIKFEVADTTRMIDLQLMLRCTDHSKADSVELMVTTETPDGVKWREPFTLYPSDCDLSTKVVESTYRTSVRWRQMGTYSITLHPQHLYEGISAAGINIIPLD